jgi:hypothetical protein
MKEQIRKVLLWLWPKIRAVYGRCELQVDLLDLRIFLDGLARLRQEPPAAELATSRAISGAHAHGESRGARIPGAHVLLLALLCAVTAQAAPSPDALNAVRNAFRGFANPFRMGEAFPDPSAPQGGGSQSGPAFRFDGSYNLLVNCITGCSASSGFTDNSTFTVGTSTINPIGALYTTSTPSISSGNAGRMRMDSNSYLFVDCVTGCSASAGFSDNSAFTAGTTPIGITGGWYSTSPTNCTSGNACAPQLTVDRKLFVQDFQGTSPWMVSNGGTFAVQAAQSGTWTVQQGSAPWSMTGTLSNNNAGTGSNNLGVLPCLAASSAPSWTASDLVHLSCDLSGNVRVVVPGTVAISAASLPLPTGAATAANQCGTSSPCEVSATSSANGASNPLFMEPTDGTNPMGAMANFGTAPSAVKALNANSSIYLGTAAPDTNTGNASGQTQRMALATNNPAIANWGQGATGSAVPSGAVYNAGNGSGNLTGQIMCDSTVIKNALASSGETLLVAAPGAGKNTYICGFTVNGASTTLNTVKLQYGTQTTTACDTGATDLSVAVPIQAPASIAPAGQNVSPPSNVVWKTGATNNQVCVDLSAAQSVNVQVWYTSF